MFAKKFTRRRLRVISKLGIFLMMKMLKATVETKNTAEQSKKTRGLLSHTDLTNQSKSNKRPQDDVCHLETVLILFSLVLEESNRPTKIVYQANEEHRIENIKRFKHHLTPFVFLYVCSIAKGVSCVKGSTQISFVDSNIGIEQN